MPFFQLIQHDQSQQQYFDYQRTIIHFNFNQRCNNLNALQRYWQYHPWIIHGVYVLQMQNEINSNLLYQNQIDKLSFTLDLAYLIEHQPLLIFYIFKSIFKLDQDLHDQIIAYIDSCSTQSVYFIDERCNLCQIICPYIQIIFFRFMMPSFFNNFYILLSNSWLNFFYYYLQSIIYNLTNMMYMLCFLSNVTKYSIFLQSLKPFLKLFYYKIEYNKLD